MERVSVLIQELDSVLHTCVMREPYRKYILHRSLYSYVILDKLSRRKSVDCIS